jgi:hypothetical protein
MPEQARGLVGAQLAQDNGHRRAGRGVAAQAVRFCSVSPNQVASRGRKKSFSTGSVFSPSCVSRHELPGPDDRIEVASQL